MAQQTVEKFAVVTKQTNGTVEFRMMNNKIGSGAVSGKQFSSVPPLRALPCSVSLECNWTLNCGAPIS